MKKGITRPDLSRYYTDLNAEKRRCEELELKAAIAAQQKPYGVWIGGKYEVIQPKGACNE